VSRFLEDAERVLETASINPADGGMAGLAILIDAWGGMRMVDGSGWRPEALEAHYGAKTVYQVTRTPGGVRVTGRSGSQSCTLESARPSPPPPAVMPWYVLGTCGQAAGLLPGASR
jgi:hypothetical protein